MANAMQAAPIPPPDGWFIRVSEGFGAAIFGAVVALVTFRTRLSKMDDRMTRIEENIRDDREATRDWRKRSDRRQLFMLEVLSDIANKVGANERMSDLTIRLLHESAEGEERER